MKHATNQNTVRFEAWYVQPIHCPFCGVASPSESQENCKHLLYVILGGNFVARSPRFDRLLGILNRDDFDDPEFTFDEKKRWGGVHTAAQKARAQLPVSMEYQIVDPGDCAYLGFAAYDDELCGWGLKHKSPYE